MERYLLGGFFIVMGTIWLLNNLGLTQVALGPLIGAYWPLLLILHGASLIKDEDRHSLGGLIWLGLGLGILGRNLGLYELDLTLVWRGLFPILLVYLGWQIIKAAGTKNARWAIMGGVELKDEGWPLASDSFIAFMGGFDLDLTAASIPDGETVLHLIAIMGGIDVKVPSHLHVECEGTAVLGGIDVFKNGAGGIIATRKWSRPGGEGAPTLRIYCQTLMGGIEIKGESA
ncbi:MAG: cell wall-active antibiotics response protein [Firmicutes bacterium]|nr:cell wall-active antibiotics response protein [Bacillota bacterium]